MTSLSLIHFIRKQILLLVLVVMPSTLHAVEDSKGGSVGLSLGILQPRSDRILDVMVAVKTDFPSNAYYSFDFNYLITERFGVSFSLAYTKTELKVHTDIADEFLGEMIVIGNQD